MLISISHLTRYRALDRRRSPRCLRDRVRNICASAAQPLRPLGLRRATRFGGRYARGGWRTREVAWYAACTFVASLAAFLMGVSR